MDVRRSKGGRRRWGVMAGLAAFVLMAGARNAVAADPPTPPPPPNIVVILADDMGFSDIGSYGGEVQTPNLDKLAAGGVRFTQFYNMARCCPTRASLLTGVYPHQAGVGAMCQDLGYPGYRGELNDRCVTIAEALGRAGYDTAMVGKWHLSHLSVSPAKDPASLKPILNFEADAPVSPGGLTKSWPVNRGFRQMWGTIVGVQNFYDPWSLVHNETPIRPEKDFYYTEFITNKSVEMIEQFATAKERKPFFLYVAQTAPHWPIQAREADIRKYEGVYRKGWTKIREERYERLVQLGIIRPEWKLAPRESDQPNRDPVVDWEDAKHRDWEVRRMATYAAMIDAMDQGIGKIVGELDEHGLTGNTLVLFLSDNGACAENVQPGWYDIPTKTRDGRKIHIGNDDKRRMAGSEETFMSYGPLWANVSNAPFRSFKHFTHEGGIATPLITHWPDRIRRKGELEGQVGHVIDILPTCLDAAGVQYPKSFKGNDVLPVEGKSLLPAMEAREPGEDRPLFWEHEGNRAVRIGQWKLVASHGQPWQLFDMKADRTELHDLAAAQRQRVQKMSKLYDEWAERCGVQPWPIRPKQARAD
jgi:arylsulfatase A-like enzyme